MFFNGTKQPFHQEKQFEKCDFASFCDIGRSKNTSCTDHTSADIKGLAILLNKAVN